MDKKRTRRSRAGKIVPTWKSRDSCPVPSPSLAQTTLKSYFLYRITMSTAHRPTWDPAQAKDVKGGSRQFSVRDMAAHTKLKFRFVKIVIFRFLL